jgi:hypothetical protein
MLSCMLRMNVFGCWALDAVQVQQARPQQLLVGVPQVCCRKLAWVGVMAAAPSSLWRLSLFGGMPRKWQLLRLTVSDRSGLGNNTFLSIVEPQAEIAVL